MSTKFRSQMKEVMQMAWSFVRKNGHSMSEALKCAWANFKLKAVLKVKIVEFYFKKTDGTLRQANIKEIRNKYLKDEDEKRRQKAEYAPTPKISGGVKTTI